jgi:hypothetical protein
LFSLALGLAGCSSLWHGSSSADPALRVQAEKAADAGGIGADGDAALKVDANQFLPTDPNQGVKNGGFKLGTSSETVEKMAKLQGCESKLGAALVTDSGPVEKYRVNCADGSVFMARCELRQCAPTNSQ